jgi:hypothetical protein
MTSRLVPSASHAFVRHPVQSHPSRSRLSGRSAERCNAACRSASRESSSLIGCGARVSARGSAGTGAHVLHRCAARMDRSCVTILTSALICSTLPVKPYTLSTSTGRGSPGREMWSARSSPKRGRAFVEARCVYVPQIDCAVSRGN